MSSLRLRLNELLSDTEDLAEQNHIVVMLRQLNWIERGVEAIESRREAER